MRTITQITAELNALIAADKAYNRVANEGGEGFERSNSGKDALHAELTAAKDAAFASEWTAEVTATRRAAWNAGIECLVVKHGRAIPQASVSALRKSLGFGVAEISKAKKLHGLA